MGERMQVTLTTEQRKRLAARSKRERKTPAQVVREALDAYLVTDTAPHPSIEDLQKVLDATFGSMPDLQVPPRGEWEERARRIGY